METELRRRAEARGLDVGSSLPEGATSWAACLLKRDRRDAQLRQAPLAVGRYHIMFLDKGGRLLTCGSNLAGHVLGYAADPAANLYGLFEIGPPTPVPVPSMQDMRLVSVATGDYHCLALSADSEVYSWGNNDFSTLGHGDLDDKAVPSKIESLSRIERIVAGLNKSAAVDENGRLFTWGSALFGGLEEDEAGPYGLGYVLDAETESQATPKQVDALSQDRVVGLALGHGFNLVVTDAGAVYSFGFGLRGGGLGHGSLEREVLPRRIEALARTRRRFVAVAAGYCHALALTENGELYGWGDEEANGHGREERTPQRVGALIGQRIKLVYALDHASCAVTEKGELFTWGESYAAAEGDELLDENSLGHVGPQGMPKRVAGLSGVEVAAVTVGGVCTIAADTDGVVWEVGYRLALGLGASGPEDGADVPTHTPIHALRVRVLNSP